MVFDIVYTWRLDRKIRDLIGQFEHLGEMGVKLNQNWWASPSKVAYHFGTSGVAVAAATGITHPLGIFIQFSKFSCHTCSKSISIYIDFFFSVCMQMSSKLDCKCNLWDKKVH